MVFSRQGQRVTTAFEMKFVGVPEPDLIRFERFRGVSRRANLRSADAT